MNAKDEYFFHPRKFRQYSGQRWLVMAGLPAGLVWSGTHSALPILLCLESGLVAYRLNTRLPDQAKAQPWSIRFVAWISVLLPLLIQARGPVPLPATVIACLGAALSVWSLVSLGESFGIAPADRGLVYKGPYRFIRHPMYLGALVIAGAAVIGSLRIDALRWQDAWNLAILALAFTCSIYRIRKEEAMIEGYTAYTKVVRWRLIPGVW
jgi:protein-S-isoprenylcysteine O-methyltransferase Ste14